MTGRQVEILQQLEGVVEERIKSLLQSEGVLKNIVAALTSAVVKAVVEELKTTLDFDIEETRKLKNDIMKTNEELVHMKRELALATDELEQYQRRASLRIFGVPECNNEDTDTLALSVFCDKLGLAHITRADVDRSHRVGKTKGTKPRPIIVKFVSYRVRNLIFMSKRKLAGSGVTIREDLTAERLKLLQAAIAKYGLRNVWTMDGRVIVKSENKKLTVTRMEDLS